MCKLVTIFSIFLILLIFFTTEISFAGGSIETIFFISEDLKSATEYKNSRDEKKYEKNSMNFSANINKNDIMYARPANYTWGPNFYNGVDHSELAFFNTGNYAYLQKYRSISNLLSTVSENHYMLWVDGGTCVGEGCILDENIISVVFPQKFKITKYDANARGGWKIVGNTYTFYSENVKGAMATFELEDTVHQTYADIAKVLAKFSNVKVTVDGNNVHVAMPVEDVFKSGDATMQKNGEKWIKAFGDAIKNSGIKELRVEGHSDSVPIKSKVYPSNWELSAARSATVVRQLVRLGIDPKLIAGVGYADSRPVADNKTAETRSKNRRIEFTIVPEPIRSASE